MNFGLDHDRLPQQHIPSDEQTPEGIGFLKTLFKPLKTLYTNFVNYRNGNLYKLRYSLQVIYLEHLLNDQFNNGLPAYTNGIPTGIYIGKPLGNRRAPVLRNKVEQRPAIILWSKTDPSFNPVVHKKIVLRKKEEYLSNLKFIVYVPFSVFDVTTATQEVIKMRGWINFYNDISNYSIVNY